MKIEVNSTFAFSTVLLFMQFAGCKYLPILNPEKGDPDQPNTYNIPETGPVIPQLGSMEFLGKSTYTGPRGVLYSVKNNAPCTGVLVDFYPNGQKKSEITYTDGYREGGAQWWTISGRLKHIRNYHRGQLNGIWTQYYDGYVQKRQEQIYDNGTEIMRRGWWPNGMKKFEVTFLNGEEKSRQSWDESGAPIRGITTPAPTPASSVKPNKQP
jgi:hypothetical protein